MKHAPQPPTQFDVISIREEMARQAFGNAYMNLMVFKLGSATNCERIHMDFTMNIHIAKYLVAFKFKGH